MSKPTFPEGTSTITDREALRWFNNKLLSLEAEMHDEFTGVDPEIADEYMQQERHKIWFCFNRYLDAGVHPARAYEAYFLPKSNEEVPF